MNLIRVPRAAPRGATTLGFEESSEKGAHLSWQAA
jgi:hypothetical protein